MLIFMTGATGLLGRRLVIDRLERGDRVLVLSRDAGRANRLFATDVNPNIRIIEGDPTIPGRWQKFIDTCDAVIHLAGAGIFDERWTEAYKRELWNSRIDSTHQVVNAIEAAVEKPRTLITLRRWVITEKPATASSTSRCRPDATSSPNSASTGRPRRPARRTMALEPSCCAPGSFLTIEAGRLWR